jgi:hypothetical protein
VGERIGEGLFNVYFVSIKIDNRQKIIEGYFDSQIMI